MKTLKILITVCAIGIISSCTKNQTQHQTYYLYAACYDTEPYHNRESCFRPSSWPGIDYFIEVDENEMKFINIIAQKEMKVPYANGEVNIYNQVIDGHTFNNFLQKYQFIDDTLKIIDPLFSGVDYYLIYVIQK